MGWDRVIKDLRHHVLQRHTLTLEQRRFHLRRHVLKLLSTEFGHLLWEHGRILAHLCYITQVLGVPSWRQSGLQAELATFFMNHHAHLVEELIKPLPETIKRPSKNYLQGFHSYKVQNEETWSIFSECLSSDVKTIWGTEKNYDIIKGILGHCNIVVFELFYNYSFYCIKFELKYTFKIRKSFIIITGNNN